MPASSSPTQSALRVFYDLRPAKQVERRMLIDALQHLQEVGFPIREYQYTGMGAFYFVDFILFHRLLGITRLLSVEFDPTLERRVRFNRPFAEVEVRIAAIGDVIATLDRDLRHLVWLDYDYRLTGDCVADIVLAASLLPSGSILLVTADVEPEAGESAKDWHKYYEEQAGKYFDYDWDETTFTRSNLTRTVAALIHNIILGGAAARPNLSFAQLFSFEYADGARMVTVGGMLANGRDARLARTAVRKLPFVREDARDGPFEIRVPRLTRKERLFLDQSMPCPKGWCPAEFELSADDTAAYSSIYRYYPTYAELLL